MFFATAFADMKVTLNTTYSSDLNDTSSDEYATFTKDFCSEVGIWIKLLQCKFKYDRQSTIIEFLVVYSNINV
jgi:hypothetical protein